MIVKRAHKILFWTITIALLALSIPQTLPARPNQAAGHPVINELMASNGTGLTDEDGALPTTCLLACATGSEKSWPESAKCSTWHTTMDVSSLSWAPTSANP